MRAQHYDAVFLGARTPTLLTAAYLARNGLRVLVLGQGTQEPTYKLNGVELPRAPSLRLPLGSPCLRHVLEAIAVMPSLKRRATLPPIALPIRLPGKSLDLSRDPALRARAIEREFPEARRSMASFEHRARLARAAFDAYVDQGGTFHGRGFRASRALKRMERQPVFDGDVTRFEPIDDLKREPRLVEALQLCARFHSNHARAPVGFPLTLAYDRALDGPTYIEGGEPWLRQVVIERIESYGGDVRPRMSADRLLVSGRSVSGIRLRTSLDEVGASAVIAAIPAARLVALLPEGSVASPCAEILESPKPVIARHVLNMAFSAEGIPRGLGRELYFLPRRETPGLLGLHLERSVEDDGLVWISVVSLVALPLAEAASLRARVLEVVREIFPFADRHLRFVDSPNDDLGLEALTPTGSEPPAGVNHDVALPETLDDLPRRDPYGLVGLPTELPISGLHLANGQCLPELGIEGEALAGLDVSRRLLERSGSARFSRLAPFRSRRW